VASGTKTVIYAALIGNSLISVTKFAASTITGSAAMMAEGIHSLVDTGNQALLLHGMKQAKRPPDADFPFGHGKEIYFWCFVVAILVFALGSGVSIYEGVHRLLHPQPITRPMVNFAVLGFALIFEGAAWWFALKEFQRSKGGRSYMEAVRHGKDPTVFVVLFEDSAALLGLLVAAAGLGMGQLTGNPMYDGLASVVIGIILAGTALWLARETKGLLIGESAEPEIIASIEKLADQIPSVETVNEALTLHMGPDYVLLNLSLDFADGVSAGQVENDIEVLDRKIRAAHPVVKRIFIEAESSKNAGP
jgi:cation diffusion facilitator family transporter